jgi:hypothetical protein
MCCVPVLFVHLAGFSRFGLCFHGRLMAHFGKRMCHSSLEPRLLKGVHAQREGGPRKGSSKPALGVYDRSVERRQFKSLDVNRVVDLADHDAGILGAYVKRDRSAFGQLTGMN